jgi:hypothetical protein
MKKVFIFWICAECNEPTGIIEPCKELGYNAFPITNFHGEISIQETEDMRNFLIEKLIEENKLEQANLIKNNTKVYEIQFL